ncbi:MAG: hypothetical protein ACXVYI_14380 [Mycobacterium sp.]
MWSKAALAARFSVAGLAMAGWAASAGIAGADPEPGPEPEPAPAPAASPAPAPGHGPKIAIDHDGTYAVGSDIAPGIYTTAGPVGGGACYWKRTGSDGAVIDNSLTKKSQVVQIEPTDKAFKSSGCQPWQLTPDAVPPAGAPPAGVQGTLGILNGLLGGSGPLGPHP